MVQGLGSSGQGLGFRVPDRAFTSGPPGARVGGERVVDAEVVAWSEVESCGLGF